MSDVLSDLPHDVRAAIRPYMDASDDPSVLTALGVEIAGKRDEAKSARASSGIESVWRECEEAYLGIDDANRHEFSEARWAKPVSMDGPVTTGPQPKKSNRSTVFLRLTSRYVDAGVAKLGEILLPADEKAFSFDCTPVPEDIEAKEDDSDVVHSELGVPLTRPLEPGETPPPGAVASPPAGTPVATPAAPAIPQAAAAPPFSQTGALTPPPGLTAGAAAPPGTGQPQAAEPPRVPLKVKDFAAEKIERARKKAKAAETRIYDWMVETGYRAEIRKVISDAARIGVGVLKAPTPRLKRAMAVTKNGEGRSVINFKEKIVPAPVWVDPWNIFPDPACGENIHDGDYILERDFMSARQVRGLKRLPGYIADQIDKVLEEGPNKTNTEGAGRGTFSAKSHAGRFEVWYFYGQLTKDEMAAIAHASGMAPQFGGDDKRHEAYCIVTLINDSVIRATLNPLDSGAFPYHSMPWQRRAQHWAGVGVAEQMRAPQRVANAALRSLLNNAGISAGSQFIIDEMAIKPADLSMEIVPNKVWYKTNDGSAADVRQAFTVIQIPNMTEPLMSIITMAERFAEETTSIPLITQGQSGATTPDTFGAAQLQNNNANQLLRSIGYAFDDNITEPVVLQYYEWLLLDPDVPDEEKGEFQINAHGSIALVERAIQDQSIAQMGNMAANPIYGVDPKKWATLFLKSKRLNPDDVQYTEEEQAKLDAAPPVEAPAVQVAKINADKDLKIAVMGQQADQQTVQHEAQIAAAAHALEVADSQTEQQRVQGELTIKAQQIDMEHQRALAEEVNSLKIALDKAKADLAQTAMRLQTERDLNAANQADERDQNAANQAHERDQNVTNQEHEMRRHVTPPAVQVPGRAGDGQTASQAP